MTSPNHQAIKPVGRKNKSTPRPSASVLRLVPKLPEDSVTQRLKEATAMATMNPDITGCIVILIKESGDSEIGTAGCAADPAAAVYHATRAINLDLIKRGR